MIQISGLLIKNVAESDEGIYTCRATVFETGELAERKIELEVLTPPKVQPFSIDLNNVESPHPISVRCNATGTPTPTITWTKDNEQKNLEEQHDDR